MDINLIGSIFSIGSGLFALCQTIFSIMATNKVKKYFKKFCDTENLEKLGSVLVDLKSIQNEIRILKSSLNQRGTDLPKKAKRIQEKLDDIFTNAPFVYKNLNNEIKKAQDVLQKCISDDSEIFNFEKNIYDIISIVKEEKEKIKINISQ